MKAMKKLFALGLVVCLLVICCGAAVAVDTSEAWYYTYAGSLEHTTDQTVTTDGGNAAYVTKNTHTAETSYVLSVREGASFRPGVDPFVTNKIEYKSGTGTFRFTYKSGYGGRGTKYYLSVYPSHTNFSEYDVSGFWNT